MRCSIMRDTIPLLDTVVFEFEKNKPAIVTLQGIRYNNPKKVDSITDIIALLTTADVGLELPINDDSAGKIATFSYIASSNWTKQIITLDNQEYYLYQNKITFGETKTIAVLSFIVKEITSDSKTFYEDLVGKVLTGSDIKAFAWLLAIGSTITGRKLSALNINSKLEQANNISVYSPVLQITTTKSNSPKYMFITSEETASVLLLSTVKSITIRKQEASINIVFLTKSKLAYTFELN